MTGAWSDAPVIWALLLLPDTTLGCGPSDAAPTLAVNVITSVEPLKPPPGRVNGPHCGVALPAPGCRRDPAFCPLITMLLVDWKAKPSGSVSVPVPPFAGSVLLVSGVWPWGPGLSC